MIRTTISIHETELKFLFNNFLNFNFHFRKYKVYLHLLPFANTEMVQVVESFLVQGKDPCILHIQYHGCCCPGSLHHQGTSSNVGNLVIPEYSGFNTRKVKCHKLFNSSPPSAAYMRQWTGSALVQVMAWRLFGAKPLPEPMLVKWTPGNKFQWNLDRDSMSFTQENASKIVTCQTVGHFVQGRWVEFSLMQDKNIPISHGQHHGWQCRQPRRASAAMILS